MDIKSDLKACSQLRQESTISETSSTATPTTVAPSTGIENLLILSINLFMTISLLYQ